MLIIRLKRIGKKNYPHYRMVVAEKSRSVKGKFIEILGSFDPHSKEKSFKKERILYWLSNGAQVSDTVYNLLAKEKIIQGSSRRIRIVKKKDKKKEESESQAPSTPTPQKSEGEKEKQIEKKEEKEGEKKEEKKEKKQEEKKEEKGEKKEEKGEKKETKENKEK
jgi:small subunit ribosomal protein S16